MELEEKARDWTGVKREMGSPSGKRGEKAVVARIGRVGRGNDGGNKERTKK